MEGGSCRKLGHLFSDEGWCIIREEMGRVVFLDEGGVLTGGQQLRQLKQVRVNILAGYSVSGLEGNMLKYWSVEWISEQ
jgi:hypothetical protein